MLIAGCASGPSIAPPPSSSSPDITVPELAYHTEWLSSDELEGRGTGTRHNHIAGRYIAREFERYGLKPAGTAGFLQPFDVVTGVELGENNALAFSVEGADIASPLVTQDYTPLGFSHSGTATGEVVFVGYGITMPSKDYNDYKDLDLNGKIAFALAGYPNGDDPHSEFAMVSSLRSKALFAREAGAAALIVTDPDRESLYTLRFDNSASSAGIIVLNLSAEYAESLLGRVGTSLSLLQEAAESSRLQPSPFGKQMNASISSEVNNIHKTANNIVGIIEGKDAASKDRYIVVGGHYDHLGWGQSGSLYKGEEPMIHNGADDNASGTAGVMELAQYFAKNTPDHSMVFMAFSGEEMGLLGSAHWVQNPTVPLDRITAMFNFDMIGRLPDSTRKLNIQGTGTSPLWETALDELGSTHTFDISRIKDGRGASDQSSFYTKDIPVLFFFTGLHSDYHRPSDDFETLNVEGQKEVLDFAAKMVKRVDEQNEKLAFTKVKGDDARQMRAFNIYVGTIPDYGASDVNGYKLSGTSPGGPADEAGMQAGDIIVKFGDTEVQNIYDYMNALSFYKPGDAIPVVVKRGGEEISVTVHVTKK